jgi:DNA-binding transcriptional MocR family regulator
LDLGLLARHIRKSAREYAARRTRIVEALARDFASWLELVPSAAHRLEPEIIEDLFEALSDRGIDVREA